MVSYYLMCDTVGMKYLLAAELRLLLGTTLCLISLVQNPFSRGYYMFPQ